MKELLKNKKLVGVYIMWVTIHFILLLISFGTSDTSGGSAAQGKLWPFSSLKFGRTYDYTEFLIYCIGTIGIIYAVTLIFPKEDEKK
jgi:hypothetical protein